MSESKISYEQKSYEIEDFWKDENITESDMERIKYLATLIPDDVKSILDAGCGNGIFINYLKLNYNRFEKLYGVDRSLIALKYVKAEKKSAGIDSIPFNDNTFDLVACLQVLEHLPFDIYENALKELCRVSRKYILISVPNEENLRRSLIDCPKCYTKFNADFHMRSFNYNSMKNLFCKYNYNCLKIFYIKKNFHHYIGLNWYSELRRILSSKYKKPPSYAICPVCGHREQSLGINTNNKDHLIFESSLKKFLKQIWPKKYKFRWLAALYKNN